MFIIILYPNFLTQKVGVFYCMKIVSLLPSATEIVYLLNLQERLVGVSHECDFPTDALNKPAVTYSRINKNLPSHKIDSAVKQLLKNGESLYGLDEHLLEKLRPDIILTQELCTAIPFFRNTLAGDFFYVAVLFGSYELIRYLVMEYINALQKTYL